MDPYSSIPSALRDDPHGPVPMDANINSSAELEAYPTTLLMDSSGTAHDFLNDAELRRDFGMNDFFANFDPYSYDFGASTSDDTNNLPLLRMPSPSPPPCMATPDALPDPDVPTLIHALTTLAQQLLMTLTIYLSFVCHRRRHFRVWSPRMLYPTKMCH
ncbi:hypothetical protein B0H13DRAFT_2352833 [Mycena leptocephala]|nr:hypothetical protein B0H13DRAFT_2352833 [Mycena leptocephala]